MRSRVMVVDEAKTGRAKRKYFVGESDAVYNEARDYIMRALEKARTNNEQTQDRFYLWHSGVCYSFGN